MVPRSWLPLPAAVVAGLVTLACGSRLAQQPPATTPAPAVETHTSQRPAAPPPEDPVVALVAASQRHFEAGEAELALGHLERAKAEFDKSIDVLLESPYGARGDVRVREQFDRLVDRISNHEILALAEGDAFTEKTSEPAPIDELLTNPTTADPPSATSAVQRAVASDLQTTAHDIPIPLNARVLAYVELFQGRLRDWIEDGLRRGSKYLPMIQSVFRAEGLPLDLAYVPLIESAFNPNAVSRAKAKGVWQFMRGTALEHGLKHDWYVDERSDPEKATQAAAKYLRSLCSLFGGDWHLALASYNGGPGTVQHAMKRSGLDSFWELANRRSLLPRETREYVPMILAAIVIARNPVQYGFALQQGGPQEVDKVKISRPVDLRRVAEWTGTSIGQIQALNPELRRWTTPVRDPDYELKVPKGTAGVVEARLEDTPSQDMTALNWYIVRKGETLTGIARKLGVNRTDLADANYLGLKSRVSPGQKLIIPRAPSALLAARSDRPVPMAESRSLAQNAVSEAPVADGAGRVKIVYHVKAGDSLFSIAQLFRTTVASLKVWNHLAGSVINPGDRLTVFATQRTGTR